MTIPKIRFEPSITVGNIATLFIIIVGVAGGWADMRNSIMMLNNEHQADTSRLMTAVETTKAERQLQLQLIEARIKNLEASTSEIGRLAQATAELRVTVENLSEAVKELKEELKELSHTKPGK